MEEEISLREILELLLKRKWLILSTTVAAIVVAAIVSFFVLPEVYTASATIKIDPPVSIIVPTINTDDINDGERIILMGDSSYKSVDVTKEVTLEEMKLQLANPAFIQALSEKLGKDISGVNVSIEKNPISAEDENEEAAFFDIKASAENGKTAAEVANAIARELPKQLAEIDDKERARKNEALLAQIQEIERQINQAEKNEYDGTQLEAIKSEVKIASLKNLYKGLLMEYEQQQALSSVLTTGDNPSLVSSAVEPFAPVKPKKMQNIAIAAILGLMIGVFMAFFLEYWKNTSPLDEDKISLEQN